MKDTIRKSIFTAVVLSMVAFVPADAYATDIVYPNIQGTTTVTLTANPQYVVTIPTAITALYGEQHTDFTVALEKAMLETNAAVSVSVEKNGGIAPMKNNADGKILYTVQRKNFDNTYIDFDSCNFKNEGEAVTLSVTITSDRWKVAPAGKYTGKIIFTIQYNN